VNPVTWRSSGRLQDLCHRGGQGRPYGHGNEWTRAGTPEDGMPAATGGDRILLIGAVPGVVCDVLLQGPGALGTDRGFGSFPVWKTVVFFLPPLNTNIRSDTVSSTAGKR